MMPVINGIIPHISAHHKNPISIFHSSIRPCAVLPKIAAAKAKNYRTGTAE